MIAYHRSAAARRVPRVLFLAAALSVLGGCSQPQVRSQKEEETDQERYGVRVVGDLTKFGNAEPLHVSGVGLVEGLEGTGCAAPKGPVRETIEHELRKAKVENTKQVLNSPNCSVVLVNAYIPPGAKKGDRIDVDVLVPPGYKTRSLRGGRLVRCKLFNRELKGNLNPNAKDPNSYVPGHPLADAEGPLLAGVAGGPDGEKRARIWDGAVCKIDRQFHLTLGENYSYARVAGNVAGRINTSFQGEAAGGVPGTELAKFFNNSVVHLGVPPQYKLNLPRYLRVVRMVPLEDAARAKKGDGKPAVPYRERLREDLFDPARAVTAALRLEALGHESVPVLREGLKAEHPLVRFCCAEALAYLGSPAGADELARAVKQQPYLRAFALTAMASLDESACREKLQELLVASEDDETRYGAFRALRVVDDRDDLVQGERLGGAFTLHEVAPKTRPLVHIATGRKAEVVLFGETPKLLPPFSILAGEFAVTAAEGSGRCTISHVDLRRPRQSDDEERGPSRTRCPLELAEVIRALAAQGATYQEVIEVIRQANESKSLSCRVRNDALPQVVSVHEVAAAGREELGREKADEVALIKPDGKLGATPTLFEAGKALTREPRAAGKQTAERK